MENNDLFFPASYTAINETEFVYLDGGSVLPSVSSGVSAFLQSVGDYIKLNVQSFIEWKLDDLRNPNFWGAVALTGTLAIIGFGMAYVEDKQAAQKS